MPAPPPFGAPVVGVVAVVGGTFAGAGAGAETGGELTLGTALPFGRTANQMLRNPCPEAALREWSPVKK